MAKMVIDVSHHQGEIDWEKVKAYGISGAIIRVSDSTNTKDQQCDTNIKECERLGIPFGLYIYSRATTEEHVRQEAALCLEKAKGHVLNYPIYIDLEQSGTESYAKNAAEIFGTVIEAAGYIPGVYASQSWWADYLNGFEKYTKWVARYSTQPPTVKNYDMWQFSSSEKVNGISGAVDMSECYKSFTDDKAPSYQVGKAYTLQVDLRVRTGPGTDYRAKTYAELTENAKIHDKNKDGLLDHGTDVTCQEVKNVGSDIWIRIPSGWIAAYYQGNVFVK